jgi:hypothetical protein
VDRYAGRPFLKLFESYILRAIGELNSKDADRLGRMTGKLQQVYGVEGEWWQVVAHVMKLHPGLDDELRRLWQHNTQLAADNGEVLRPEDFAMFVADQNLAE